MRHTQLSHTHYTLMHQATVVGLKDLHDLLNKRLEQQVKHRTARSSADIVLCVHEYCSPHTENTIHIKCTTGVFVPHSVTRLIFNIFMLLWG